MLSLAKAIRASHLLSILAFAVVIWGNAQQVCANGPKVRFNSQIRPILNEYCVSCHGGVKQAGDISFIYRSQVLDTGILEPGDPENSELIARITSDDPDLRMPPVDKHPDPLPPAKIELLKQWIREGAEWGDHWAFVPPREPQLKEIADPSWVCQKLDRFVLARLDSEGLVPSPPAEPTEWLRRVSFDLTGLPPTQEELDHFVEACRAEENQENAVYEAMVYEATVDRLLASPHFGERWAAMWLDLARYADSKGLEADRHRDIWPYRSWLIDAFNDDMPFDQFTIRQLAGDLLPDSSVDDLIATAFHRNTQTNTEGGTDDEEFRVAAVIDRINTTWTVWHGLTFGCVQCHSHPYDPFRNQEYYSFMAFFNNTADHDLGNEFPTMKVPIAGDAEARASAYRLQKEKRHVRRQLNEAGREIARKISRWQPLTPTRVESTQGKLQVSNGHQVSVASGTIPVGAVYTITTPARPLSSVRLDILPDSDDPASWPERGAVLSHIQLQLISPNGETQSLKIAEVYADHLTSSFDPMESLKKSEDGWGGFPKLLGPRWAVFVLAKPLDPPAGASLVFKLSQNARTTGGGGVHLRRFALSTSNSPELTSLTTSASHQQQWQRHKQLEDELKKVKGVNLPVMRSRGETAGRSTWTFVRGNWLDHGEIVSPGVPGELHSIDEKNPSRLDLARWLVADDDPLTARVLVNRLWAELFGIGIVETLENFGSTGTPPSHPELLDHLALSLQREHQWHIKPFLRDLVLSATYRQANRVSDKLLERDPQNRLLARGPRTRLSAEMVRDQALAASGLLNRKLGGPSVMPPQPSGVWQSVYNDNKWKTSKGADRYRRAVYTYWKRTSPYPSSMTFDAPSREICSARRVPTNTPLQALVTLNDPVYVELSRTLATRSQKLGGAAPRDQIRWAYRIVTQHPPSSTTLEELVSLYRDALVEVQEETSPEKAALTTVANTILNLDEAMTK